MKYFIPNFDLIKKGGQNSGHCTKKTIQILSAWELEYQFLWNSEGEKAGDIFADRDILKIASGHYIINNMQMGYYLPIGRAQF